MATSAVGGFLQGFLGPIEKKIKQQHEEDQQQKEELRKHYLPLYMQPGLSDGAREQIGKALKGTMSKQAWDSLSQLAPVGQQIAGKLAQQGTPGAQALPAPGGTASPPPANGAAQQQSPGAQALPPPTAGSNPFDAAYNAQSQLHNQQADTDAARKVRTAVDEQKALIPGEVERRRAMLPAELDEMQQKGDLKLGMDAKQVAQNIHTATDIFSGPDPAPLKQIKLAAMGIQMPGIEEVKNIPGDLIQEKTDGLGNPIDPKRVYTRTKDGKFVPEAPPPKAEPADSSEVRALQEYHQGQGATPEAAKKMALDDFKKKFDTREKGAEVRIINQQAAGARAGGSGPASGMSDEDMRALVEDDYKTGNKTAFGLGRSADRDRYNRMRAQFIAQNPQARADAADFKAGRANLQSLERVKGNIGSFENAFQSDLQNAREASEKVPRGSMKKFNNFEQFLQGNFDDNPELAEFAVYTQTAINQYSRLVSSASGGGVSTDTARREAMAILDKAMPTGAFNSALNAMEREAKNRIKGIDQEIENQKKRLASPGSHAVGSPAAGQSSRPRAKNPKTGEVLEYDGSKWVPVK